MQELTALDAVSFLLWVHVLLSLLVLIDSATNYFVMRRIVDRPTTFIYFTAWAILQTVHGLYRVLFLGSTGSDTAVYHLLILTFGTFLQWRASDNLKKVLRA